MFKVLGNGTWVASVSVLFPSHSSESCLLPAPSTRGSSGQVPAMGSEGKPQPQVREAHTWALPDAEWWAHCNPVADRIPGRRQVARSHTFRMRFFNWFGKLFHKYLLSIFLIPESRGRANAKAMSCPGPEEARRAGEADGMETWKKSRPELHHPPSRTVFIPSEGAGSLHP